MSERTQRVSEVIRREISTLISRELSLEGLLITVASVEVTPDLKHAYIYISMIEQTVSQAKVVGMLNRLRSRWQGEVGDRLETKFTPRLHFQFDKALERGDRVMEVMLEIERQKEEELKTTGEYPDDSGKGPVEI